MRKHFRLRHTWAFGKKYSPHIWLLWVVAREAPLCLLDQALGTVITLVFTPTPAVGWSLLWAGRREDDGAWLCNHQYGRRVLVVLVVQILWYVVLAINPDPIDSLQFVNNFLAILSTRGINSSVGAGADNPSESRCSF